MGDIKRFCIEEESRREAEEERRREADKASFFQTGLAPRAAASARPYRDLQVYGKPRKIPAHYFDTKAKTVLMCFWVLDDPQTDLVLAAINFEVKDIYGEVLFPRDPLHRLADASGSAPLSEKKLKMSVFFSGECSWENCKYQRRPNSKYCSRNCSNKNARQKHKQRKGGT